MRDVHVHFLHGSGGNYTKDFFLGFIDQANLRGLKEIYLLEHTHQFIEFETVYTPVVEYNSYQRDWVRNRMNGSIKAYLDFIDTVRDNIYPVQVKFGLEVCYIPETSDKLADILNNYDFDFLVGSIHWIDGWGFDHPNQKELWNNMDIDEVYLKYYSGMYKLCESNLFDGLAHPDSTKCFGYTPSLDMRDIYDNLSSLLVKHHMYAENSGGLKLNYSDELELGLNKQLLDSFLKNNVTIYTASDAHKQSDVGMNIKQLENMLKR